jgi:MoaD family protein
MPVKVKMYSRLKTLTGSGEIYLERPPETVRELLDMLTSRFGEKFRDTVYPQGRLRDNLIIMVNGHSIKLLKGLDTPLKEEDEVYIDVIDVLEIVGGG